MGGAAALGIGGAIGAALGSLGSSAFSLKAAREQRKWQEKMMREAYQRTVKDMRLAGLNPILATRLNPASAPSGAMPSIPDFGASMARGMSAGTELSRTSSAKDLMNEQGKKLKTAAGKDLTSATLDHQQTLESMAKEDLIKVQREKTTHEAREAAAQALITEADVPSAQAKERVDTSWYGKALRELNRISQAAQGISQGASSATSAAESAGELRRRMDIRKGHRKTRKNKRNKTRR